MASLGILYVASEWIIRIAMLFYVPQRRPPAAARAWLLLIFFLPWAGLLLYGLIGRVFLPRSRIEMQAKVFEARKALGTRGGARSPPPRPPLPPEFAPALDLAEALSEFSVVGGNQFELLPDYDAAIDRLVADVERAHTSVHLLYYIYAPDAVGERVTVALEQAAQRGVNVRVVMDAIGSRPALRRLAPRMRAAGIEVTAALPLRLWGPNKARVDLRNHRKIAVVDGRAAFFGSQNIVSARANRGLTNEEMMVRATGPIVRDLHAVLLADRYFEVGDIPPEAREPRTVTAHEFAETLAQVLPSGPGYSAGTTEDLMIALMSAARRRVVLTTPYFIPSESFLLAMELAARRGVAVHLIVDKASNKPLVQFAQQSYYEELLDAGVRLHRYYGNFLHAKHMSVDEEVVLIGSSNFDMRSFALNAEVSVLIYDRAVAAELGRVQAHYLARSEHLTAAAWARRGVMRRVLENLARLTDSLL